MNTQSPGQGEDEDRKLDDLVQLRVGATAVQSRTRQTTLQISRLSCALMCFFFLFYHLPIRWHKETLLVLILICVVDDIEESQLVDTFGRGDHA